MHDFGNKTKKTRTCMHRRGLILFISVLACSVHGFGSKTNRKQGALTKQRNRVDFRERETDTDTDTWFVVKATNPHTRREWGVGGGVNVYYTSALPSMIWRL